MEYPISRPDTANARSRQHLRVGELHRRARRIVVLRRARSDRGPRRTHDFLALAAFEAASSHNAERVIDCLNQISGHLEGCTHILPRMYERNNPSFFYNRIRPFLLGTQVPFEQSDGVYYEEENGEGRNRQYKGPTAAESSLWQFVDISLGVSHDDEFLLVYLNIL